MSVSLTIEEEFLRPTTEVITRALARAGFSYSDIDARLDLLEAVSCLYSGIDLNEYRSAITLNASKSIEFDDEATHAVKNALDLIPYDSAMALSSLTQESLLDPNKKTKGAYYTDYRIAGYLSKLLVDDLPAGFKLLDPACGTGILLAAIVAQLIRRGELADKIIGESIFGCDLSERAIRGAILSIASLATNLGPVKALGKHLKVADSLVSGRALWSEYAPSGFDAIIGNPPWERIKLTRHEYLVQNGRIRNYGDEYDCETIIGFREASTRIKQYSEMLSQTYQRIGELDTYQAFLLLSLDLLSSDGDIAILLPAGIIRSKGSSNLRKVLSRRPGTLTFTLMNNHSKFFNIDSRFKFVALHSTGSNSDIAPKSLSLKFADANDSEVLERSISDLSIEKCIDSNYDLGLPEVRNADEQQLLEKMQSAGERMSSSASMWNAPIVRELDMTSDRTKFMRGDSGIHLPLIEGRMVHQYRCGAKAYVSGTGRSAKWRIVPIGESKVTPQFYVPKTKLPEALQKRSSLWRIGFCDITGQTNERAMLASRIPPGCICGNKVPTIIFSEDSAYAEKLSYLWLAIVNSFVFDWMLRRYITTTVNFFILRNMSLPHIDPDGDVAKELIDLVKRLESISAYTWSYDIAWQIGEVRARIDAVVAVAYGLTKHDIRIIQEDFLLVDKMQPPIDSDIKSTVTFDLIRASWECAQGNCADVRIKKAQAKGAVPYIPGEYARAFGDRVKGKGV